MKNLTMKASLYAAAAIVLSAVPSFAQQSGHVSVKVPFEFTAGSATLPAGDYDFQEARNGVIMISSFEQHKAVMVLTNAGRPALADGQPSVKFDKMDGQYSLSEINLWGEPSRKLIHLDRDGGSTAIGSKLGVTNAASKGLTK
jgi:hypothetical protein